jgi:hypothetical protein
MWDHHKETAGPERSHFTERASLKGPLLTVLPLTALPLTVFPLTAFLLASGWPMRFCQVSTTYPK